METLLSSKNLASQKRSRHQNLNQTNKKSPERQGLSSDLCYHFHQEANGAMIMLQKFKILSR